MKKSTIIKYSSFYILISLLFITSCKENREVPPFPSLENEYKQPVTKNFEFSEPDTLIWKSKDPKDIKPLPIKRFNWDKLPEKPIDIGLPFPLTEKYNSEPFSLDSLPSAPFSLDSLLKIDLKIKVTVLGEPEIQKAGSLSTLPEATRGVFAVNSSLGLPSQPRAIMSDKTGALWIGSFNGIVKYDSENLKMYGAEQGLHTGLVYTIFQDSKGRFWVGNDSNSISIIDFEAKLVYEIDVTNNFGNVYGIIEANDGKFWLSNHGVGYNIIDFENKTLQQFNEPQGLVDGFTISPFQDKDGLIWLSTGKGAHILDLEKGRNMVLNEDNGLNENFIGRFFQEESGRIWITSNAGYNILNPSKNTISSYSKQQGLDDKNQYINIFKDSSGTFWLGTANGIIYSLNEETGQLEKYNVTNASSQVIFNIIEDIQGDIWVSIIQGGLYKIDQNTGRPGNFTKNNGLSSNSVWTTLETSDGKIWIGTYEGIDIYDPETRTIKHLGTEQGLLSNSNSRLFEDSKGRVWSNYSIPGISIIDIKKGTIQHLTTLEGLEINTIVSIVEDDNGNIWMGGGDGEILMVNLEKTIFKYYLPEKAEEIARNNILIKDSSNTIWIGSLGSGIQKIDATTLERVFLNTQQGLVSNEIFSLNEDAEHNIWAASEDGVVKIDVENHKLTTFKTAEGIAANDVYAIADYKGLIYTGTSKGLTILEPIITADSQEPSWKVKTVGREQGLTLVDFSENSFTFDKNNRFWAGVEGAMLTVINELKVDTTALPTYITSLNIMDKRREFYNIETIQKKRSAIDTLLLANDDTFISHDSFVNGSSYQNEKNIKWDNTEGPYNTPIGLTLPYTENYLSFNYNTNYFSNTEAVVYRYILEGIDNNWSTISKETTSENYRDLPPGEYTFKVASKGFNQIWGKPTTMTFTILPPWWNTWWATLLFLLVGTLGIWSIINYRSRWLKKENRILEERVSHRTVQLKTKIDELKSTQSKLIQSEKMASLGELTAGIAHEIQNPLNFVNNFSEVNKELLEELEEEIAKGNYEEVKALAKDVSANEDKIIFHGKRADGIVKGMLQHSRSSTGQKEMTDINTLSDEYLRLAYHGLRAKDKSFNATLNTDFDDSIDKINIVPQDMGRVILNLITNAFYVVKKKKEQNPKGYEPTVSVSTKKQGNMALIKVSDNGNGVPKEVLDKIFQPFFTTKPSGEGTGLGLSLSYDIVQVHGGELTVETKQGEGTTFTISLPMN